MRRSVTCCSPDIVRRLNEAVSRAELQHAWERQYEWGGTLARMGKAV
jgi:hypothetical protein